MSDTSGICKQIIKHVFYYIGFENDIIKHLYIAYHVVTS